MFEALITPIVKLEKDDGEIIGELTTAVCTSHYGQPEWSGCSQELEIGDVVIITDPNGGDPWKAKVVGQDANDGWLLVETEDCADRYYAIHPNNGWINSIDCDQDETSEVIVAGLNDGTYKLQVGIRLGDGWGCI